MKAQFLLAWFAVARKISTHICFVFQGNFTIINKYYKQIVIKKKKLRMKN